MKNFKEFVISKEEATKTEEDKQLAYRQKHVDYFNMLKEIIDEANVYYVPGDSVFTIEDSSWDDTRAWTDLSKHVYYQENAYPLTPSRVIIWYRTPRNTMARLKTIQTSDFLPDMGILKEVMEEEGLRVKLLNWRTSNAVIAEVYVAD